MVNGVVQDGGWRVLENTFGDVVRMTRRWTVELRGLKDRMEPGRGVLAFGFFGVFGILGFVPEAMNGVTETSPGIVLHREGRGGEDISVGVPRRRVGGTGWAVDFGSLENSVSEGGGKYFSKTGGKVDREVEGTGSMGHGWFEGSPELLSFLRGRH